MGVAPYLTSPGALWAYLEQNQRPYTRVTTWTRVVDFYKWLLANGHVTGENEYERFRHTNQRLFKHCYQPRFPQHSFAQAKGLVAKLADPAAAELGKFLLSNGARYSESVKCSGSSTVGKGNKTRTLYGREFQGTGDRISYCTFRRHLKKCGLRPHDLRKLCATELVAQGVGEADLCKIMGWTSMATAKSYLIPKKDQEIKAIFERMLK